MGHVFKRGVYMSERPNYRKQFEEHPDVQALQGPQGRLHESAQAKFDL